MEQQQQEHAFPPYVPPDPAPGWNASLPQPTSISAINGTDAHHHRPHQATQRMTGYATHQCPPSAPPLAQLPSSGPGERMHLPPQVPPFGILLPEYDLKTAIDVLSVDRLRDILCQVASWERQTAQGVRIEYHDYLAKQRPTVVLDQYYRSVCSELRADKADVATNHALIARTVEANIRATTDLVRLGVSYEVKRSTLLTLSMIGRRLLENESRVANLPGIVPLHFEKGLLELSVTYVIQQLIPVEKEKLRIDPDFAAEVERLAKQTTLCPSRAFDGVINVLRRSSREARNEVVKTIWQPGQPLISFLSNASAELREILACLPSAINKTHEVEAEIAQTVDGVAQAVTTGIGLSSPSFIKEDAFCILIELGHTICQIYGQAFPSNDNIRMSMRARTPKFTTESEAAALRLEKLTQLGEKHGMFSGLPNILRCRQISARVSTMYGSGLPPGGILNFENLYSEIYDETALLHRSTGPKTYSQMSRIIALVGVTAEKISAAIQSNKPYQSKQNALLTLFRIAESLYTIHTQTLVREVYSHLGCNVFCRPMQAIVNCMSVQEQTRFVQENEQRIFYLRETFKKRKLDHNFVDSFSAFVLGMCCSTLDKLSQSDQRGSEYPIRDNEIEDDCEHQTWDDNVTIDFGHHSKTVWHEINPRHGRNGSKGYDNADSAIVAVEDSIRTIWGSVDDNSPFGTKRSARETLRKICKTVCLSDTHELGSRVQRYVDQDGVLELAMLHVVGCMTASERAMMKDVGFGEGRIVPKLNELIDLSSARCILSRIPEVLRILEKAPSPEASAIAGQKRKASEIVDLGDSEPESSRRNSFADS